MSASVYSISRVDSPRAGALSQLALISLGLSPTACDAFPLLPPPPENQRLACHGHHTDHRCFLSPYSRLRDNAGQRRVHRLCECFAVSATRRYSLVHARRLQGSGPKRRDTGKRRDEEHVGSLSVQAHPDPYMPRRALKSEEELADLRHKKSGKSLASFHRKQNAVSHAYGCALFIMLTTTAPAHYFVIENNGGAHGGGQG